MLKGELAKKLKERHPDFSLDDLQEAVDVVFESMTDVLSQGGRVEIRGFGSLSLHRQKGKIFKNPKTGKTMECPSNYRIVFKPGKALKRTLD